MSASKVRTACRRFASAALLLADTAAAQSTLDAAAGQALFEKNWVTPPASTRASDGLGPYYDARSCAGCHPRAGQGTAPEALTIVIDDALLGRQLQRHAVAGLPVEAMVEVVSLPGQTPWLRAPAAGLQGYSLRLAPPLAGVAAFEQVVTAYLQALADPLDANRDGVSGRLGGRYGWKAEVPGLRQQIGKALSLDIGIGNPEFPAVAGDCTPQQPACVALAEASAEADFEASSLVLDLLVAYLASLPVPARPAAESPPGARLFGDFGCAACHVPSLPTAAGPPLEAYSDLLLHDLGPGLADSLDRPPAAAGPGVVASPAEWRTAPLWAVASRSRLLHDGRAATLDAAIRWHDGEAAGSRRHYEQAEEAARELLLGFLRSL
jgi:CxxC motif-containing protein (DUF1111 family)